MDIWARSAKKNLGGACFVFSSEVVGVRPGRNKSPVHIVNLGMVVDECIEGPCRAEMVTVALEIQRLPQYNLTINLEPTFIGYGR